MCWKYSFRIASCSAGWMKSTGGIDREPRQIETPISAADGRIELEIDLSSVFHYLFAVQ
jgi:hypothetical protein